MQKESVSLGQAFSLIALFIMGTTVTIGTAGIAKNNLWVSIQIAILAGLPIILFQIKLLSTFPGKDLFEIVEIILGKVFGKLVILIYTWYALHMGSLVMRNFREFVHTVALPETPEFMTPVFMGVLGIWFIRSGIEVMARSAKLLLIITMGVTLLVLLLAIPQFNLDYLRPFMGEGISPVIRGAFSAYSFPFAEIIIISGALFSFDHPKALNRAYLGGYFFAGIVITILGLRNIMMMGIPFGQSMYFPSYSAVSRIRVGEFIQRIEGSVDIVFQTTSFFKFSVCLYVFSNGISRLFNLNNYRIIVLPSAFIMMLLTQILFESVMEMSDFAFYVYPYYALPFQAIFPTIIFIVYLIRNRKGNLTVCQSQNTS